MARIEGEVTPGHTCEANERNSNVKTKVDFVSRYRQHEFGNRTRTWESMIEFDRNMPKNMTVKCHIRNRVAGGPTWYNIAVPRVLSKCKEVIGNGDITEENIYISEMAPHEEMGTIQGNVIETAKGLHLEYWPANLLSLIHI